MSFQPASVSDGVCYRVGAHGESPDVGDVQAGLPEEFVRHLPYQELALGAHGCAAGVNVVGRTSAACEGKTPHAHRAFNEKIPESITMIHERQSGRRGMTAQGGGLKKSLLLALAMAVSAAACSDDTPIDPASLRFGQLGRVEIAVAAPRGQTTDSLKEMGSLDQTLVWNSSGAWYLTEAISYRELVGDETRHRYPGDPGQFAGAYATLITQLNDIEAQKLFLPDTVLPQDDTTTTCGPTRTRLSFSIYDDARGEEAHWVQCADGSLDNLTPVGAGPAPGAARLVLATLLARSATVGDAWRSAYSGSVPFGTLDRGENSSSSLTSPVTYIDAKGFEAFWAGHVGGAANKPVPEVDFNTDMVVVGLVGVRQEAGDSVEVRRILQVDEGTLTEVYERIPGEFCSPAARVHTPYHIVVAPRTPIPHRFADVRVEQVPCGG